MFVNDIPEAARAGLVLIADDAELIDAARFLTSGTDIVVVREGVVQGVVTKTDVVRQMSVFQGAACCPASTVMTRNIVLCYGHDLLQDVSLKMKTGISGGREQSAPWVADRAVHSPRPFGRFPA